MAVKVREKVKGSGEWWLFIDYRGDRRATKVVAKRAALELKADIEKKIKDAEFQIKAPPPVPTFEEYAKQFMAGYAEATLKPSTRHGYKWGLQNHILPVFGKKLMSEITRKDIKEFIYAKKADGYAPRSVLGLVWKMSSIFQHAIEDAIVQVNPTLRPGRHVKIPRLGQGMDFLTPEEGAAVLQAAREHYPKAYPVLLLAMNTGMREGEIIALQWGDIDWRGRFLEVRRNDWNGHLGTPKNGMTRRVDLAQHLIDALTDHRRRLAADCLANGKEMSEWVFPRRYYYPAKRTGGERMQDEGMRKLLHQAARKAGLRHVRFHALRHSFCSWMVQNGENLVYVKEQAGHSSIDVTVDIYGHLIPGQHRGAMDRLAVKLLEKPATQTQPDARAIRNLSELKEKIS